MRGETRRSCSGLYIHLARDYKWQTGELSAGPEGGAHEASIERLGDILKFVILPH